MPTVDDAIDLGGSTDAAIAIDADGIRAVVGEIGVNFVHKLETDRAPASGHLGGFNVVGVRGAPGGGEFGENRRGALDGAFGEHFGLAHVARLLIGPAAQARDGQHPVAGDGEQDAQPDDEDVGRATAALAIETRATADAKPASAARGGDHLRRGVWHVRESDSAD